MAPDGAGPAHPRVVRGPIPFPGALPRRRRALGGTAPTTLDILNSRKLSVG